MPWSETSPMDQKTQFIADELRATLSIVELCDSYGISRKTGYKWIDRYLKEGPGGLRSARADRSSSPNSTPAESCRSDSQSYDSTTRAGAPRSC